MFLIEIVDVISDAFSKAFCYQKYGKNGGFGKLLGAIWWFWEEVGSRTLLGVDLGVHVGCPGGVLGSTWAAQGRPWEPFWVLLGTLWQLWEPFSWFREAFASLQGPTSAKIRKNLKNKENIKKINGFLCAFACLRLLARLPFFRAFRSLLFR